jgi:hypothetical protein
MSESQDQVQPTTPEKPFDIRPHIGKLSVVDPRLGEGFFARLWRRLFGGPPKTPKV